MFTTKVAIIIIYISFNLNSTIKFGLNFIELTTAVTTIDTAIIITIIIAIRNFKVRFIAAIDYY